MRNWFVQFILIGCHHVIQTHIAVFKICELVETLQKSIIVEGKIIRKMKIKTKNRLTYSSSSYQ